MKKLFSVFGVLFLFSCGLKNNSKIVGEWEGIYERSKFTVIFKENWKLIFIKDNQAFGDDFIIPDGDLKGKKVDLSYELDNGNDPFRIAIILHAKDNSGGRIELDRLKGVYRLLSPNKLEVRIDHSGRESFHKFDSNDRENTFILTRK